jgi:hypothetical protein
MVLSLSHHHITCRIIIVIMRAVLCRAAAPQNACIILPEQQLGLYVCGRYHHTMRAGAELLLREARVRA